MEFFQSRYSLFTNIYKQKVPNIFQFVFHLEQMISMRKLALLSLEFTFLRIIFYLSSFPINYLFTPLSTDQAKKLISHFMIPKFLQEIHQNHMIVLFVHMITNISSRSIPLLKKLYKVSVCCSELPPYPGRTGVPVSWSETNS